MRIPVLAFLLLLVLPVRAEETDVAHFRTRDVEIHIAPVTSGAAPVAGYQLWYTTDDGLSWQRAPGIHRGAPPIAFSAPADGRYGFRAVAVDRVGQQQSPPQPGEAPELSCVIDTRPPDLDVMAPKSGQPVYAGTPLDLHWAAADENLGPAPVTIEFQREAGGPWQAVPLHEAYGAVDRMPWFTPFVDGALGLKITVRDQAGNVTEWVTNHPVTIVPYSGFRGARGVAADPYSAFRRFAIFYRSRRFSPVEIERVEIWVRRDLEDWELTVDPDGHSPYIYESEADGLHYCYLRILSRNGEEDRPPPGPDTAPDLQVLVDTHPPLGSVTVAGGEELVYHRAGESLEIRWAVEDEFLAPDGIRLDLSLDGGAYWTRLPQQLKSGERQGAFMWRPPLIEAESLMFRVVAQDLAGNQSRFPARTRVHLVNPTVDGPEASKDHHRRAVLLLNRGDRQSLEAALERLDLAINYDGRNAAAWHDRGVVLTHLANYEEALASYERAHQQAPAELDYRFSLIQGYLNLRRQDKDPKGERLQAARAVFDLINKVDIYKREDYRNLLATYRVLEAALKEE